MEELHTYELPELKRAYLFAAEKHASQKRKYSNEPYIIHPEFVACLLTRYTNDRDLLKAALLHDTVEDTDATIDDIRELFNPKVADLVEELTIDTKIKNILGKKKYMSIHLNTLSSKALLIKLVDRLHNVLSLLNPHVPIKFIKWYWKETVFILDNLDRSLDDTHKQLINTLRLILDYIEIYKLT